MTKIVQNVGSLKLLMFATMKLLKLSEGFVQKDAVGKSVQRNYKNIINMAKIEINQEVENRENAGEYLRYVAEQVERGYWAGEGWDYEDKDECELCGGTGEMEVMERVYPNEPHTAPMKRECICQKQRHDHDD